MVNMLSVQKYFSKPILVGSYIINVDLMHFKRQKDYAGLLFDFVKLQGIFKELKEYVGLYIVHCLLCFVDELLVHLNADIVLAKYW